MTAFAVTLGPQPWLVGKGARAIAAALDVAGGSTRLVGGAVRDSLLGLKVSDIDFATVFEPANVLARLEAAGLKAVPTGIAHGTVTAVANGFHAEVTTLRRDVATDGRHATVAFTADWRADAARRDFTINALYANPVSGEIDDFFGGLDDLAARRVRFIGVALDRIAEDHLRILRFFRFSARFAVTIDADGLAACTARANDLMALSRERVRDEMAKLLVTDDPAPTLAVMLDHAILAPVLPEIERARLAQLVRTCAGERAAGVRPGFVRRLAALLPVDAMLLDDIATRLRLSKVERKRLVLTADRGRSLGEMAYRDGIDSAIDRGILSDNNDLPDFITAWSKPVLPVSGRHLIARGLPPGPEVSRRLGEVEREWIAAGFPADIDPIVSRVLAA
ncbi:CCA tRNA nucleotidyltransferase [Polymorphobacter sp. PAMC 29334]|uniref:CCA tRNA nucleotidyltransferase n=1 Tax=Polymorphobacter sp. PAMC 29334 TaxID=2862331 RepID=UPI001C74523A|nr:CCA tRNA nucleotidyltransferase [Polymorphobacter sp. PAMC 29334]QYE34123.1 CCA tRNA nucleotidyltransferase [Polymorphobacter sp. PAMC 29334]